MFAGKLKEERKPETKDGSKQKKGPAIKQEQGHKAMGHACKLSLGVET